MGWERRDGDAADHDRLPALPFTVRPGGTPVRVLSGNLRARWWVLAGIWLLFAVVGLLTTRSLTALLVPTAFVGLVGVIVGTVLLCYRFYAGASLTVTATELVVKRVRRRVLPRAEVGEAILGLFGSDPVRSASPAQAIGLAITDRQGRRFVRLPVALWPREELAQAIGLLGLTPRPAEPADEKRLTPWAIRHRFITAFAGAIVLLALIVGVIVLFDHQSDAARSRSAAAAVAGWAAYRDRVLGSAEFPDLHSSQASVSTEPGERRVSLTIDLVVGSRGHELPPAETGRLIGLACAYRPAVDSGDLVTSLRIDRPRPTDADTPRMVTVDCAMPDLTAVRAWLAYADEHPLRGSDWSSLEFGALDGWDGSTGTRLDAGVFVSDLSRATMERALGWLCAGPRSAVGTVTLGVSGQVERTGRTADLHDAGCGRPGREWREWQESEAN